MRNYDSPGDVLSLQVPAAGVTTGQFLSVGGFLGWAAATVAYASSTLFDLLVHGVGRVPKLTADSWAAGVRLYFNPTTGYVSAGNNSSKITGSVFAGIAARAATNSDTSAYLWRPFTETGEGGGRYGLAESTLDFAEGGGAIAAHLRGDVLPTYAVPVRSYYFVETTFTSAGDNATIGAGFNTDDAAGLVAAVAIDAATDWDGGWHEGIQVGTAATFGERLTANRAVEWLIAVEAVTAGKATLFVEYVTVAP